MTTLRQILDVIKSYGDKVPVPVFDIIKSIGLGPEFKMLPSGVSGKIVRVAGGDKYKIVINFSHHLNRQRFTAAHELGHYIFHRDLLAFGVGDTLAYRAEGTEFPNPNIGYREETEANRFASNLLMANRLIDMLRAQGVTEPRAMAEALGVSEAAMRIKLGLPPKAPVSN